MTATYVKILVLMHDTYLVIISTLSLQLFSS